MKPFFFTLALLMTPSSFGQVTEVPLEYTMEALCGEFKLYSAKWPNINLTLVRPYTYSESRTNGIQNVRPLTPKTEGSPYENQEENESESKSNRREAKKESQEKQSYSYSDQGFFNEDVKSLNGAVYLEKEHEQKVHVCVVTLNDSITKTTRIRTSAKSNEEALSLAREELGFLPEEKFIQEEDTSDYEGE